LPKVANNEKNAYDFHFSLSLALFTKPVTYMKKTFALILILLSAFAVSGQEKKVKTGWKFGGALRQYPMTPTWDSSTELF
jgi:hypothetical protein